MPVCPAAQKSTKMHKKATVLLADSITLKPLSGKPRIANRKFPMSSAPGKMSRQAADFAPKQDGRRQRRNTKQARPARSSTRELIGRAAKGKSRSEPFKQPRFGIRDCFCAGPLGGLAFLDKRLPKDTEVRFRISQGSARCGVTSPNRCGVRRTPRTSRDRSGKLPGSDPFSKD
jgi:hypothetical protein